MPGAAALGGDVGRGVCWVSNHTRGAECCVLSKAEVCIAGVAGKGQGCAGCCDIQSVPMPQCLFTRCSLHLERHPSP